MRPKLFLPGIFLLTISCGGNDSKTESDKTAVPEKKEAADKKMETSSSSNDKHLFDIKAAKIVYQFTGKPLYAGDETFYFDDYGNIAVLIMDKGSNLNRNHTTSIWKDKKTTLVNHETKKVATSPFRVKETEPPGIADISDASRKGIGYEKMPDETVAGKTCEVWYNKKMNIKYYLWKKIELKLENQGVYVKEATSVEEISGIPSEVMKIPDGYNQ